MRGERLQQAHRSHAYQHLARRWRGHRPVVVAVLILNIAWLLPCAVFALRNPRLAGATTVIALLPLVVLAVAAGSGRKVP
jgi:Fuc2NAc and GlcNAc transferase